MAEDNICTNDNLAKSATQSDELSQKISTLFFDLDNTLIPTRAGDSKACRRLADILENEYDFTKQEATKATSTFLKSFRRCPDNLHNNLDSWRTNLWCDALSNHHKHLANEVYAKWLQLRFRYITPPTQFIQMLECFRDAGYQLGIITNGPSNAQWEKIRKLQLSQYFDCVLVSSDLPWEKPNPNIFRAACNFLNVKPTECAMIGDKLATDIKGGHLAKFSATFWLPLNPKDTELCDMEHPPDVILRNLMDLTTFFPAVYVTSLSNSSSNLHLLTSKSTAITKQQTRRRFSQVSYCETSTCGPVNQRIQEQHMTLNKTRRVGSLPDIEFTTSETESSSDSLCS